MPSPNIILIVLDAVRKDHLSCYGYERETTPNIDHFANEATRYTQAIAAAPWTPPSHASMFTGQYPSTHRVFGGLPNLETECPTLAEVLSSAGYTTFGFSNSHHTSSRHCFDRGFDFYHDILDLPRLFGKMYEFSRAYIQYVLRNFYQGYDDSYFQLQKLQKSIDNSDPPFFGFINLNSAHSPYDPPKEYREYIKAFDPFADVDESKVESLAESGGYDYMMGEVDVSELEWDLLKRRYDGELRYLDDLLGLFFSYLDEQELFDESLIIVTSDHGEHFGEHGRAYHQFSLFEELINVPLIVKWPGQCAGEVSDMLTSLVDLAPTVIEATDTDIPECMQGKPLKNVTDREFVFSEYAGPYPPLRKRLCEFDSFRKYDKGLQSIRSNSHKLILDSNGERTLYELTDGEYPIDNDEVIDELTSKLKESLKRLPTEKRREDLDKHTKEHLKEMGYM